MIWVSGEAISEGHQRGPYGTESTQCSVQHETLLELPRPRTPEGNGVVAVRNRVSVGELVQIFPSSRRT